MRRLLTVSFIGLALGFIPTSFCLVAYAGPTNPEKLGNDIHHAYRPPWRERDQWQRSDGCPANAVPPPSPTPFVCHAHEEGTLNQWAIDLNKADDCGAPLRADRSGSARVIPWYQGAGYGNLIGITHLNSLGPPVDKDSSWYAHMENFPSDQPWDTVLVQGDFVGNASNTGGDYACHLHYQVNDEDEDPVNWSGYNTLNVWFGAWPYYGYDIQHLSTDYDGWHASNNTGAGYARPYTGPCPPEGPAPSAGGLRATLTSMRGATITVAMSSLCSRRCFIRWRRLSSTVAHFLECLIEMLARESISRRIKGSTALCLTPRNLFILLLPLRHKLTPV
ncbi:MAG: hypothetical protein A2Y74_06930 [Actinobacteria bacterium RBG_13_63_9]|nr:MAG: hypothetical protein A2Y74_06930 [Actinobacteria bacterium RBG_13_63_9]